MARPRTPIGSNGVINTVETSPGVWRSRTLHRFPDGSYRQVERVRNGKTGAKSAAALREALVDIAAPGDGSITSATSLSELADLFLQTKRDTERADRTIDTYRHQIEKIIRPRLGDMRVSEATTGRLQVFFTAVSKEHGHGSAKGCRSVLSGMFAMALRNDAILSNPVVGVEGIRKKTSRAAKAIPLADVAAFRVAIRGDDELQRLDMVDLWDFMLFTGARIGESLGLRWSYVDFEAGTVAFAAGVNRVRGKGLVLQEWLKTDGSTRTISVPAELLDVLRVRPRISEMVFPSMLGKLRDTSNTEADWRANRDRLGYPGLTSHAFRKTVATALDVAGLSARAIAEYLGHKQPSMTQDVYMSRTTGSSVAASTLSSMFGVSSESSAPRISDPIQTKESGGPRGARTRDPRIMGMTFHAWCRLTSSARNIASWLPRKRSSLGCIYTLPKGMSFRGRPIGPLTGE
ncbi:tyrosine recombinase XerC [Glaciihabitans sp. dw_435]|uniref:site-specific integrase n=1 Tax=Glaciihabitans sp. dw_435 TaxID=2720081 RepID=UPI0035AC27E0